MIFSSFLILFEQPGKNGILIYVPFHPFLFSKEIVLWVIKEAEIKQEKKIVKSPK